MLASKSIYPSNCQDNNRACGSGQFKSEINSTKKQLFNNYIDVYPDPSNNSIYVDLKNIKQPNSTYKIANRGVLRIESITGYIAHKEIINKNVFAVNIDVNDMAPGLYIVSFIF